MSGKDLILILPFTHQAAVANVKGHKAGGRRRGGERERKRVVEYAEIEKRT